MPIRAPGEAEARAAGLLADGEALEAGDTAPAKPKVTPPSPGVFVRDLLGRLQQRTVRS